MDVHILNNEIILVLVMVLLIRNQINIIKIKIAYYSKYFIINNYISATFFL